MTTEKEIALSIKKHLKSKKLRQVDVAQKSGISLVMLNKFLNGKNSISLKNLIAICSSIDVTITLKIN